jgi:hypothetical protein
MTDQIFDKVSSEMDPLKKILGKIPGFKGYIERQNRRDADKLLREEVANRFSEQEQRISALQREFIDQGEITYVDDLEAAAIKLRTFADRVRRASYGYSGLFDAVKINELELVKLYEYDSSLLDLGDEVGRAIDNVEASIGGDGLPAAFRNLTSISRKAVAAFDQRREVILGISNAPNPGQTA